MSSQEHVQSLRESQLPTITTIRYNVVTPSAILGMNECSVYFYELYIFI